MILPEAVISDADGTLIDTLRLIRHGQFEASKTYLGNIGVPNDQFPDYNDYEAALHRSIGGSANDTLEQTIRLLFANQLEIISKVDFTKLHSMLNPVQDRIAPEYVKPYDGLTGVLTTIGSLGIKFAIFTSGMPHHVVRNFGICMPELGLSDLYLDASMEDTEKLQVFIAKVRDVYHIPSFTVVTCDDVHTHKPDPSSVLLAAKRLHANPDKCAILGDHSVDMQAGVRAGVSERIGIIHGFDDRQALINAGATRIVNSLTDFTDLLAN